MKDAAHGRSAEVTGKHLAPDRSEVHLQDDATNKVRAILIQYAWAKKGERGEREGKKVASQ